ncbi:uncharacterized protein LOC109608392 [Aethina tumida]|uniref:uncharacterized protein LOC109608392 n=1 Tax=Aethina tumida TaxID=116153 RepID=UPI00096AEB3E|nr:uncharacterized protein LOC109608392 [Aethina tumida]
MKIIILFYVFSIIALSQGITNYLQTEEYDCIKCLCHARTGCYRRRNCALYSINYNYWKEAGQLKANLQDPNGSQQAYNNCMRDENCIVGTIIEYTNKLNLDCNCDNTFDCKDRLMLHINGRNCNNKNNMRNPFMERFNTCAESVRSTKMSNNDFISTCVPEAN